MSYQEIKGDLIELALQNKFDLIAHGCNCFCVQGTGIALKMDRIFNTLSFDLEQEDKRGDVTKLGNYDDKPFLLVNGNKPVDFWSNFDESDKLPKLTVCNLYTQYYPGANFEYLAFTNCLKAINKEFYGLHIGLPQIGAGIGGGDWNVIKQIIQKELKDMSVTVVIFDPQIVLRNEKLNEN